MSENPDARESNPPDAEPTHTERWERAVENAVKIERPPGGWPWQKRKGKGKEAGDGA
jgi:hypothetical protein